MKEGGATGRTRLTAIVWVADLARSCRGADADAARETRAGGGSGESSASESMSLRSNAMFRKTLLAGMLTAMAATASAASPIDLNQASAEKLANTLDGVGAVRAESIVDYRRDNGDFASVNALVQVEGIGEATLKKNRDQLTVESE
jgi:competence protein ComEA